MKINELNKLVMVFVCHLKHYNHDKYWKHRVEVINPNSKVPKLIRLVWLYQIKKVMHLIMHLWVPDLEEEQYLHHLQYCRIFSMA